MISYQVPQPALEQAQLVIGSRVATWDPNNRTWFYATITKVIPAEELTHKSKDEREPPQPGTLCLRLHYPPQKNQETLYKDDLEWDQVFNQAPIMAFGNNPGQVDDIGQVCSVDWSSLDREILSQLGAVPVPYPAKLHCLPPAWKSCAKLGAPPARQPLRVSGTREKRKQQDPSGTQGGKRSKPRRKEQPAAAESEEQGEGISCSQPLPRSESNTSVMQQAGASNGQHQPTQQQRKQRGSTGAGPSGTQRRPEQGAKKRSAAGAGLERGAAERDDDDDFQEPPLRNIVTQEAVVVTRPGEGTAGQLKSCELINFMCHEHFTMDFGLHVNLISGTNGSGKSAVLQALQCCMGVKAQATGRFKSAKEFIRHGQDQAVVLVQLWNTGASAYQPELLGRVVTVERRISRASGNTFSIKNSQGQAVLRGATEVEKLLDAFSINAANPAVIMTQDTARSFAGEQSEKKKYEVFIEAMLLDEIYENLQKAGLAVAEQRNKVEDNEKTLQERVAVLQEKEQLLESMREVTDWKAEEADLGQCIVWEVVREWEENKQKCEDTLERKLPGQLAHYANLGMTLEAQQEALNADSAQQNARLEQLNARMQGQQQELQKAKEEHKRRKEQWQQRAKELRDLKREVRELEQERDDLVASALEVDEDYFRATQADMEGFKQRMRACKEECDAASAGVQAARTSIEEKKAIVEQAVQQVRDAQAEAQAANSRIAQLQGDLRRMEDRGEGTFGGPQMQTLLQRIQMAVRQGKFQRPPVGPIGSVLALEDDKWAVAVEAAVGKLLDGFVVHSVSDQRLLQKMARDARMPVTCFISNFDTPQHNIPPERLPPPSVQTVLKVLKFKDGPNTHVVKNILIDQARIERTVLAGSVAEASHSLRDNSFMERYKISAIWARDGSQARKRGRTETIMAPNTRLRPRLVKDVSVHIQQCREELAEAQSLGAEKKQALEEARRYEIEARQAKAAAESSMRAAKHRETQTQGKLNTLASQRPVQVEAAQGNNDTAVRVAELQNRIAAEGGRVIEAESAMERAKRDVEEASHRVHEVAQAPKAMEEEIEECTTAVTNIAEQAAGLTRELMNLRELEGALKATQEEVEIRREQAVQQIAAQTASALAVCSREEASAARERLQATWQGQGKSQEEVAAMLALSNMREREQLLARKIAHRQANAGIAVDELQAVVAELGAEIARQKANHHKAMALFQGFHRMQEARVRKYKEVRNRVSDMVSHHFASYMRRRGHVASIKVDFRNEQLIFSVGVNGGAPVTNMKSLSGGERSMTTICFLMALGHAGLCPPYVALDEFDIFMDSINRRYSLMFLLDFAHTYSDRQFLFLTPQDISAVEEARQQVRQQLLQRRADLPADFIHVVKMRSARVNADQA